jgi:hypothetical protein
MGAPSMATVSMSIVLPTEKDQSADSILRLAERLLK